MTPPLPPGFVLNERLPIPPTGGEGGYPPLPPGFVLNERLPVPPIPPETRPERTWGSVASGAMANLPGSAAHYGQGLWDAVTSPLETAKAIGQLATGAGLSAADRIQHPITRAISGIGKLASDTPWVQQSRQLASDVGDQYATDYGSIEGFKNKLASDPVGVLSDASLIGTGGLGGAAKAAQVGGAARLASVLGKGATAAQYLDPATSALAVGGQGAKLGKALTEHVAGLTAGVGKQAITEAVDAGVKGGSSGEAFRDMMRGGNIAPIIDEAETAIAQMRRDRSAEYQLGMQSVNQHAAPLNFAPINKALNEAQEIGTFRGRSGTSAPQSVNESTVGIWADMRKKISEWESLDPTEFHTPEGIDKLKQAIGDIRDNTQFGTPQRVAANKVYNSIRTEITKQAPEYGKVMAAYEKASDLLKDIKRSLFMGKADDASITKLQSVLRNNVNTQFGHRTDMARKLEEAGANTLFPKLAGHTLNSWTPRGIQGAVLPTGLMTMIASGVVNPLLIPTLAASSPRVVGEVAHGIGRAARPVQQLSEALSRYSPISPYAVRQGLTRAGAMQNNNQTGP